MKPRLPALKLDHTFGWYDRAVLANMAFERVYTVWDYWDGPRSGIAAYSGQPYHFQCEWNEVEDDYGDTFMLTPIDDETLSLVMEQWSIWREWERAFHRGEASQSTHPARPGTDPRYSELEATINARISTQSAHRKRARAKFRVKTGQPSAPAGVIRELEVEWTDVAS